MALKRIISDNSIWKLLCQILDTINDGVVVADTNCIFYANSVAQELCGSPLINVDKARWSDLGCFKLNSKKLYRSNELPLYRAIHGENVRDFECYLHNKKQPGVYLLANANPIYDDNVIIGGIVTFRDISERKKLELRLQKQISSSKLVGLTDMLTAPNMSKDVLASASEEFYRIHQVLKERAARLDKEIKSRRMAEDEVLELKGRLAERKIVERAKGIIMMRSNFTEERAYLHLNKAATSRGTKLVDIAQAIIIAEDIIKATG